MIKFAKVINDETFLCEVGLGSNSNFYKSIGMIEQDVEQSEIDNNWYLAEKCPHKSEEEKLEEAKEAKYKENETIRDAFLVSGVEYRDILWDSDLEQKLNLMAQTSVMGDEDSVVWVAMDGVTALECTKEDLMNIGALLTTMTAYVWQFKNPAIKAAIAEAQTEEELNEIEIVYDMGEINEEIENEVSTDTTDSETETTI